jgi:hypothetical protein
MTRWLRRLRGAAGMGLIWAAGGAGIGGLIELIDNILPGVLAIASAVDMWPQTLAIPGFLGGVVFSAVLGIAGRRRRFGELSLPRFAAWGAVAGLLLGGLAVWLGAPGLFVGITTIGSAIAASGSLALAKMAERRELLYADEDVAPVGLAGGGVKELREGRD